MTRATLAEGPTRAPDATPPWSVPPKPRRLLAWAAGFSMLAGLLHAEVTPEHFGEWWGYGTFFAVSTVAQLALGILLLLFAVHAQGRLPAWARRERLVLWAGIAGNVLLVLLYVYSRVVGNPAGPMAGEREPVETLDLVTKAAEVALVGLLAVALGRGDGERAGRAGTVGS